MYIERHKGYPGMYIERGIQVIWECTYREVYRLSRNAGVVHKRPKKLWDVRKIFSPYLQKTGLSSTLTVLLELSRF